MYDILSMNFVGYEDSDTFEIRIVPSSKRDKSKYKAPPMLEKV